MGIRKFQYPVILLKIEYKLAIGSSQSYSRKQRVYDIRLKNSAHLQQIQGRFNHRFVTYCILDTTVI